MVVTKDWITDSMPKPASKALLSPLFIPVSPSLSDAIINDIKSFQNIVDDLNVKVEIHGHDKIVLTPSNLTRDGWEILCQERINTYIKSNIAEVSLDISMKAIPLLLPTIMQIQKSEKCFSYTPPAQGQGQVHLFVGHPNVIQKIKSDLDGINARITVTTVQIDLDEMKFAYIMQLKQNDVSLAYPTIDVKYTCPNTLTLRGTVHDINEFWTSLHADYDHFSTTVDIKDQQLFEFLQSNLGQYEIKVFITKSFQISAAVHVTKSGGTCYLHLLGEPKFQQLIKKAGDSIPEELCSRSLLVGPLYNHFHSDKKDIADYNDLCSQHNQIIITTTDKEVCIMGFRNPVDDFFSSLKDFIDRKCQVTEHVELEIGMWRLFQGPLCMKWNYIASFKMESDVKITANRSPQGNRDKYVIQLDGRIDTVKSIREKIISLEGSVFIKQVQLTRPGIKEYIKGEIIQAAIHGIEAEHKVCIEINENMAHSNDVECIPVKFNGYREVLVACTKELKKVIVCVGDITEFNRADVLVNAANGDLQHAGGVAKAFADKGGPIIQDLSTKYTRTHGTLCDGDIWLTTDIGHLPCKALIHAVGPNWSRSSKSDRSLFSAFFKSLKSASANAYKSIAFPAISTGVYGCPYDVCAQCWIEAVVKFLGIEVASPLSEIYFVANDAASAEHVVKAMKLQPSDAFSIVTPENTMAIRSTSNTKGTIPNIDYLKVHKGSLLDVKVCQ